MTLLFILLLSLCTNFSASSMYERSPRNSRLSLWISPKGRSNHSDNWRKPGSGGETKEALHLALEPRAGTDEKNIVELAERMADITLTYPPLPYIVAWSQFDPRARKDFLGYLHAGYPMDFCDHVGYTALHVASHYGDVVGVQLLLEQGARASLQDYRERLTPLHIAVFNVHKHIAYLDIIKILLDHKDSRRNYTVDVDVQDCKGNTALHIAAGRNSAVLTKLLLDRKAAFNLPNEYGLTALDLAKMSRNGALIGLFYR